MKHGATMSGDADTETRAFFEFAAIGAVLVEPSTQRIRYVNARLARLVGRSREELGGMSLAELALPEELESIRELFDRLSNKELDDFSRDQRLRRKDGSFIWVKLTASMIESPPGSSPTAAVTVQDISAQQEDEQEVLKLRRKLTANLTAMTRFHELGSQGSPTGELPSFLMELLDATIANFTGAGRPGGSAYHGIDAGSQVSRRFQRQRADRSRPGLLGMKERAASMNGDVNVESNPGKGTTVFVRLPVPAPNDVKSHV